MTTVERDSEIQAVPVIVLNQEQESAGVFGAWVKHAFTGPVPARQILPQDTKRKRAVIVVTGTAAQIVYIGTQGQTQSVATAAATAGELSAGMVITTESQSEQYVIPDAAVTDVRVAVLIERYL